MDNITSNVDIYSYRVGYKTLQDFLKYPSKYKKNKLADLLSNLETNLEYENTILNKNEIISELNKESILLYNELGEEVFNYLQIFSRNNIELSTDQIYLYHKIFSQFKPFVSNNEKLNLCIESAKFHVNYDKLKSYIIKGNLIDQLPIISKINTPEESINYSINWEYIKNKIVEINKLFDFFFENPNNYSKNQIESLFNNFQQHEVILYDFCHNIKRLNKIEIKKSLVTESKNNCNELVNSILDEQGNLLDSGNYEDIIKVYIFLNEQSFTHSVSDKVIGILENILFQNNYSNLYSYLEQHNEFASQATIENLLIDSQHFLEDSILTISSKENIPLTSYSKIDETSNHESSLLEKIDYLIPSNNYAKTDNSSDNYYTDDCFRTDSFSSETNSFETNIRAESFSYIEPIDSSSILTKEDLNFDCNVSNSSIGSSYSIIDLLEINNDYTSTAYVQEIDARRNSFDFANNINADSTVLITSDLEIKQDIIGEVEL